MQRRFRKTIVRSCSVLFMVVCLVAFIGFAGLQADDNDPNDSNDAAENGENANQTDDTEAGFQNAAQAQHANNVASLAALSNLSVADAIAKAEETGEAADIEMDSVAGGSDWPTPMDKAVIQARGWPWATARPPFRAAVIQLQAVMEMDKPVTTATATAGGMAAATEVETSREKSLKIIPASAVPAGID